MAKSIGDCKYTPTSNYENLMIVDGLNLAFRFKHAKKKNFAVDYLHLVESLAKSYEAKYIFVLGDGGSKYRKDIYPAYKANREQLRSSQTAEELAEFEEFLNDFNTALELLNSKGYATLKFIGVEADDIAGYIVNEVENTFDGHIWLISSDKDWDLLVSDTVSRFSYRTRKETTIENWNEHYSYEPSQHISIKVLMGDKGDNVPGVDGIGEKRAYTLLREYGTAFDVYDAIPINDTKKYIQNLNEFAEQILINYELMDLKTYAKDALLEYVSDVDKKINEVIYEN